MAETDTNLLVGVILSIIAGVSLGLLIAQLLRSYTPQAQSQQQDRSVLFDRDELGLIKAFHYVQH